jgi:RNA polymerase sigma-54 factor
MALEIKQQLRQVQQLVMTPQLQQAIKLLQYNHIEMVDVLEHELKENPLLEVGTLDEPLGGDEGDGRTDGDSLEALVKEPEQSETIDVFGVDWESYLENYGQDVSPIRRSDDELPPIENRVSYHDTLFRYVLAQLRLTRLPESDTRIALEIIGNVDERGYLAIELQELADSMEADLGDVERVLSEVQKLDPPGIAARDLRECLTIQARALEPPDPLVVSILEEAFDFLQQRRIDKVARKLRVSLEEVKEAVAVISTLEPKPGRPFSSQDTVFVAPDIFIAKVGNEYSVILNDDGVPSLRISSFYKRQLHSGASNSKAKDYIQEKMRSAMWLIKSIHQRQRTIYKVTWSIIKFQREFFDKGIDFLKPLVLKDVAADIEMHESTISRVTTNKYVHTPRGIFELKYFFNSGIRHGADTIASESVKNQILRIVRSENPKKPASDKRIVEILAAADIHIARRTVAKYRELLNIPPSSKRRNKF